MATKPIHPVRACRKCGIEKPATTDYFHRQGDRWLRTQCRDCATGIVGFSERQIAYRETGILACTKCAEERPHTSENFAMKLGKVTSLCRLCSAADCMRRYEENREARQAENRARWHANKEKYSAAQRLYYQDHREERREYDKKYAEDNKDRRREWLRIWSSKNPDRIAFYNSRYRQTAAGKASQKRRHARWLERHGDRIRSERRAAYHENREAHLAYQRQYYAANRDRFRQLSREWYRNNRDKIKAWDHARRIANGSGISFTHKDVGMIIEEQDWQCSYCLSDIEAYYEADHFIPVAKGGGNEPENIVLACLPCNRSKGAKLPWDWRPDLFRPPQ